MNDDTTIVIPIVQKVEISFDFEGDEVGFSEGETLYINYTLKNATDDVQVTASSDGNFVTKVEAMIKQVVGFQLNVSMVEQMDILM